MEIEEHQCGTPIDVVDLWPVGFLVRASVERISNKCRYPLKKRKKMLGIPTSI
jgi:hypothetical protein